MSTTRVTRSSVTQTSQTLSVRGRRSMASRIRYRLTPLTTVGADVEQDRSEFVDAAERNSDGFRVMSVVEFQPLAAVSGSAHVGVRRRTFVDGTIPPFEGLVAGGDLSLHLAGTNPVRSQRPARPFTFLPGRSARLFTNGRRAVGDPPSWKQLGRWGNSRTVPPGLRPGRPRCIGNGAFREGVHPQRVYWVSPRKDERGPPGGTADANLGFSQRIGTMSQYGSCPSVSYRF